MHDVKYNSKNMQQTHTHSENKTSFDRWIGIETIREFKIMLSEEELKLCAPTLKSFKMLQLFRIITI